MSDSHVLEETKKPRVLGDIPPELIREAMSAITDPAATLAPEVSRGRASRPRVGPGAPQPLALSGVGRSCWMLRAERRAGG